jgi:prepilin-type N-terminal cleavage/methylation domain-containing protein
MNPHPIHPVPVGEPGVPGLAAEASWMAEGRAFAMKPVARAAGRRDAFSLVELLVAVSIILVLMGLLGGAVQAARGSYKRQQTQALITRLDEIIRQQFGSYASQAVITSGSLPTGLSGRSVYRSWYIRRNLMSADLPDRWTDVARIASGTTVATTINGLPTFFPLTAPQRAYQGVWNNFTAQQRTLPATDSKLHVSSTFAGAECLFMIVMQGGVADCLDCGGLRTVEIGDKDEDGAPEFWDAWQNPIGFILWPAAFVPGASGDPFYSGTRSLSDPFSGSGGASPGLGMRPLIYSAGPDGEYGLERNGETENLLAGSSPPGRDCGNWATVTGSTSAAPLSGAADNITNFDAEVGR